MFLKLLPLLKPGNGLIGFFICWLKLARPVEKIEGEKIFWNFSQRHFGTKVKINFCSHFSQTYVTEIVFRRIESANFVFFQKMEGQALPSSVFLGHGLSSSGNWFQEMPAKSKISPHDHLLMGRQYLAKNHLPLQKSFQPYNVRFWFFCSSPAQHKTLRINISSQISFSLILRQRRKLYQKRWYLSVYGIWEDFFRWFNSKLLWTTLLLKKIPEVLRLHSLSPNQREKWEFPSTKMVVLQL